MTDNLLRAPGRAPARFALPERQLQRFHPSVREAVCALAALHPRIADLALSFPALLFALAVPRRGVDPACALARVVDGQRLTEVAAAIDVPMWLRRLPPEAFRAPIPALPDGDLLRRQIGNHLPRSPRLAPAWLALMSEVAELALEPIVVWAAREFNREPRAFKPGRVRLLGLWAWFSCQPATFGHGLLGRAWTPDIQVSQALTAARDWLTSVTLHANLGAGPLADIWLHNERADGYDFVPLDCAAAVAEEAASMRNCVRTYGDDLAHHRARLWSVRRDGARVATLRVGTRYGDPLPLVLELKGPDNAPVGRELWWLARRWLQMHDLPANEIDIARWGTAALDRSVWQLLWRPYWLAKQRIPQWLPLAPSRAALEALDRERFW